jgi:hypothetical protein
VATFGKHPQERKNLFFGLLAEGDNQSLLEEDGDKLKFVIQVDANNIMELNPNSCHNANPTIVIIFWSFLGQNILHI